MKTFLHKNLHTNVHINKFIITKLEKEPKYPSTYEWLNNMFHNYIMNCYMLVQPTPVFLPGESLGRGSLVGCRFWGRAESDTTEATWQWQSSLFAFMSLPTCYTTGKEK
jgi:hypothetical protein